MPRAFVPPQKPLGEGRPLLIRWYFLPTLRQAAATNCPFAREPASRWCSGCGRVAAACTLALADALAQHPDGWTRVTASRGAGLVPTDYLCRPEELPSGNNPGSEDEAEAGTVPAAPAAATAMGTFRAANGAELSVREGETVAVLGKVRAAAPW